MNDNKLNERSRTGMRRLLWFIAPILVLAIGALATAHSKAAGEAKMFRQAPEETPVVKLIEEDLARISQPRTRSRL